MELAVTTEPAPPSVALPPPWQGEIDTGDAFLDATRELLTTDPALLLAVSRRAQAQAMARADWAGAARAVARRAGAERALGMGAANDSWHEAYALVERSGDMLLRLRMLVSMTATLALQGRFAESLALSQQALEDVLAAGKVDMLGTLLQNMGATLSAIGECELALECLEERRRLLAGDGPLVDHERAATDCNIALQWVRLARRHTGSDSPAARESALRAARETARRAHAAALGLADAELTIAAGSVFVDALLEAGDATQAQQRARETAAAVAPVVEQSDTFRGHLAMMDIVIALHVRSAPEPILEKLRWIESRRIQAFATGPSQEQFLACMSQACERAGDFESALRYLKLHAEVSTRTRSVAARESARVMRHTMLALRQESVEFMMHDLRSPLAAATNAIDAAMSHAPSPEWAQRLQDIALCVDRASVSAEQTLGILHAEHVPAEQLRTVDLAALADDVCETFATLPARSARLSRDLAPPAFVRGERSLLQRALDNLLSNAFTHAPAGSRVEVRVARTGGDVVLTVQDSGPGLDPAMRARLFRRYATGRSRQGHGLGLALVARVARVHNARIEVDSEAGRGTRIALRFKALEPPTA